jgi:hypothetical protein
MRINDLLNRWQDPAPTPDGQDSLYPVPLSLRDAARIEALALMHPGHDAQRILADLVHSALDELEAAMPYQPGRRVLAEDDQGDPIYEDLGPTPRFYCLSHAILQRLRNPR